MTSTWANIERWRDLATKVGKEKNVDPDLILAIIKKESYGDPNLAHFEPNYSWLYHPADFADAAKIPHNHEINLQSMGFGLMQVQGAVCREYGFHDDLFKLFDPHLNIWYGATHLKHFLEKYGDEVKVISSYNQGSPRMVNGMFKNQRYVDYVYFALKELRAKKQGD